MKSIKIGIIVAVAVIGVLATAGSAAAQGQAIYGISTDADCECNGKTGYDDAVGKIVTLWIEDWTDDNCTKDIGAETPPNYDYYYYDCIALMLSRHGIGTGDYFNVTVQMFPSGTQYNINGNPGASYDNHGYYSDPVTLYWRYNGTCPCMPLIYMLSPSLTYEKELGLGWNLISLPLTSATDMTVENVINTSLGGSYDALCKYNAVSNNYETLSSTDVMENGVGYFIHMTQADTWTYSGAGYTSMNEPLEDGLNMVGWMDCNKTISSGLTSIAGNYTYAASWNATAQEFETYNPAAPDPDTPGGFNDFFDMERGTGYFISMKVSDTLDESC